MRSETNSEVLTLKSPRGPNVPAAPRNHLTTSWPRPRQKSMDSGIFAGSVSSASKVSLSRPPLSLLGGRGDGVARSIHSLVAWLETLTGGGKKKKGCKMKIKPGNGARKPRFPLPVEFFFCMQEASWFSFVWSLSRAMTFPGLTVVRGHLCHSRFQSFRILPSFSQLSGLQASAGLLRTREFTRYNLKGREGERRGQN